jgi:hypothetical protein
MNAMLLVVEGHCLPGEPPEHAGPPYPAARNTREGTWKAGLCGQQQSQLSSKKANHFAASTTTALYLCHYTKVTASSCHV